MNECKPTPQIPVWHGHPFATAQASSSTDPTKSSTIHSDGPTRARELGGPQHRVAARLPDPSEQRARGGVQQRQHHAVEYVDQVQQQPPQQRRVGEGSGPAEATLTLATTPPGAEVIPAGSVAGGVGGVCCHIHGSFGNQIRRCAIGTEREPGRLRRVL